MTTTAILVIHRDGTRNGTQRKGTGRDATRYDVVGRNRAQQGSTQRNAASIITDHVAGNGIGLAGFGGKKTENEDTQSTFPTLSSRIYLIGRVEWSENRVGLGA